METATKKRVSSSDITVVNGYTFKSARPGKKKDKVYRIGGIICEEYRAFDIHQEGKNNGTLAKEMLTELLTEIDDYVYVSVVYGYTREFETLCDISIPGKGITSLRNHLLESGLFWTQNGPMIVCMSRYNI